MAAAIKAGEMMAEGKGPRSPSKRGNGYWRSVRNLEQFWEMMAFRSECSSGRLVGFMWVVIAAPADTTETEENVTVSLQQSQSSLSSSSFSTTPPKKKTDNKNSNNNTTKPQTSTNKPKLSGRIISRLPRIKYANTSTNTTSNDLHNNLPSPSSPYYLWPPTSRGRLVLARKQYDKALELLLLRADFADERLGVRATRSWVDEVGLLGGVEAEAQAWGERVMGRKKMVATPVVRVDGEGDKSGGGRAAGERMVDGNGNGVAMATSMTMNVLSVKRKAVGGAGGGEGVEGKKVKTDEQLAVEPSAHHVNILGGGMVRKKPKKIQPTPVVQE
jgi:regulator of Ty1 transposition protein 109